MDIVFLKAQNNLFKIEHKIIYFLFQPILKYFQLSRKTGNAKVMA